MPAPKRISLRGAEHAPMQGARVIGPTAPHELIEISLVLTRRQPLSPSRHRGHAISHNEYASTYGADPSAVDKIRQFAREYNLQFLETGDEVHRRTVLLTGTAANLEKAFGIELNGFEHPDVTYRSHAGSIQMPEEYAPLVQAVLGLDNRPVAFPHFRWRGENHPFTPHANSVSYNPNQVAALYNFPQDADGSGQCIGIIELGGGYRPADLHHYFKSLGIKSPEVRVVLVDHAKNRPTNASSADGEVMLDLEVVGAVANGAKLALYFAPNTDRGFHDALSTAIHDELNNPSVISISWGGPEESWSSQAMESFDQVAQEAAALGITITVASGDNGSSDGVNDGKTHVDFPASSPHVLACGGTRLDSVGDAISSETVWNDGGQGGATGGGYSTVFPRPAWQAAVVTQPNRGVPDVAGDADPASGYNVRVDGQQMVVGGTSAVAPLWAGLIALYNQKTNSRLGFINPAIYGINQSPGFRDIIQGDNGQFKATNGWDACTGLGSPMGTDLLEALAQHLGLTVTVLKAPPAGKEKLSA